MSRVLVHNIGDLITLRPLAAEKRPKDVTKRDLGRLRKAWMAVTRGRVEAVGSGEPPSSYSGYPHIDAGSGLVMPGLVDSHTHPVFAGSRAKEFCMRLNGATYQEIAAEGGGIRDTVTKTRQASNQDLEDLVTSRLNRYLRLGVTTLEVKSGYGLSVEEELRHLRILNQVKEKVPQELSITCLALHAKSPEFDSLTDYVKDVNERLLPVVATESLASWVDAFIEAGYYSVEDVEPYVKLAKNLGLGIRLHADEFSDARAAVAAARWRAASADHLQFAPEDAIKAMAAAGVVATILPGTSLYTSIPYTNARKFLDGGVAVALASDFNPGSCQIDNLAMLATVGALHCGLRPVEAVAAVTYVPAFSLGLGDQKGALAPGYDGDFLIYELDSIEQWLADFGRTPPREVWIKGDRHHQLIQ